MSDEGKDTFCPMCGGRPQEARLIGFRGDTRGHLFGHFYVTVHEGPLTKRCWHPLHEAVPSMVEEAKACRRLANRLRIAIEARSSTQPNTESGSIGEPND